MAAVNGSGEKKPTHAHENDFSYVEDACSYACKIDNFMWRDLNILNTSQLDEYLIRDATNFHQVFTSLRIFILKSHR